MKNLKHLLFLLLTPVLIVLIFLGILEIVIRALLQMLGFELSECPEWTEIPGNWIINLSNWK